jgi:anti-anti-sigma factor
MTVAFLHQAFDRAPVRGVSLDCPDSSAGVLTVTVRGEVDACNAKEFAVTVCDLVGTRRLTLDLSQVDFIAIEGCVALHSINLHVMRANSAWQVIASPAVSRLLSICDRERLIPVADDQGRTDSAAELVRRLA